MAIDSSPVATEGQVYSTTHRSMEDHQRHSVCRAHRLPVAAVVGRFSQVNDRVHGLLPTARKQRSGTNSRRLASAVATKSRQAMPAGTARLPSRCAWLPSNRCWVAGDASDITRPATRPAAIKCWSGTPSAWSLEVAFHDSKQSVGSEEPQDWTRRAVEGTASLAMPLHTLIVVWLIRDGHRRYRVVRSQWYPQKEHPSFADMLATLRRESIREKVLLLPPTGLGRQQIIQTPGNHRGPGRVKVRKSS